MQSCIFSIIISIKTFIIIIIIIIIINVENCCNIILETATLFFQYSLMNRNV